MSNELIKIADPKTYDNPKSIPYSSNQTQYGNTSFHKYIKTVKTQKENHLKMKSLQFSLGLGI